MIGQYLPNKTKVVLFIGLKFFQHLNVARIIHGWMGYVMVVDI
jgi:hypothetical protein